MATFNDLNRVMEDTIRVDMKKRWTPQEVKFINNKNEYFGTFHGRIESIGAVLANVELSNATFYNERGEAVDINKLLNMEQRLIDTQDAVEKLSVVVVSDVPEWIAEAVKSASSGAQEALDNEISARQIADEALQKLIDDLDAKVDVEIADRISADTEIYSTVDKEVKTLNETIQTSVDVINGRIDTEVGVINDRIDDEVDSLLSTIANDKHYSIRDVSTFEKNYVLKDFAINSITDTIPDGKLFHKENVIGKVGGVKHGEDGKISSIDVTTLKDFSDKEIEHCFPPNASTITLNGSNDFKKQVLDGYFLTLPDRSTELHKKVLKLESHRTGSRDIKFNGLTVGAVVGDFPEAGTLISGRVELVPGADSELKVFNGRVFTFDEEHHEDVFTGPATGLSSKIVVLPSIGDNGTIHLKQNFSKYNALPLRNHLCSDVEFGRVDYGEISPESVVVRVTKNVSESLTGVYVLTDGNDFKLSIDADHDIDFADGMVRISRKHDLYTYDLFCDDSGTTYTTKASVTPKLENRVIGDGTFDVISVHVEDDEIPSFGEQTIILERSDGFTKTIKNAEGIVSTISFNEADSTLQARTPIKGLVTTKDYYINKDVKTLVEQPRDRIAESQEIDLADPAYETTETDGERGWDLEITEHTGKEYPPYDLTVNVDEIKQITLEFPKDDYDNTVSHEFIARISINGTTDFIKVNIADDVELDNRDRNDLFIKGGETSTIQFRQVGFRDGKPLYLVEDLKEHDLTHFIEELHKEIENRKTADEDLSVRITKNEDDIADIYNRISGIINYKGVLDVNTNYDTFAKMFEYLEFDKHDVLSAGWFYLVESDKDPLYKHMVEGVKVGKGDYLKIENSKRVEDILSSDVLILDTLDGDVVHVDDLKAVSSDLNTKIETEKTNITNMSAYVDDLCVAISSDVIKLSTEVHNLCSAISTDVNTLSGDFHDLADKTFLKPEDAHVSSYYMVLTEECHDSDDDRKPHPQYYMTFRDGTLVLVKKEDSSEKKEEVSEEKKED